MAYNILRIGFLLFIVQFSYSQNTYSTNQLQAFANVYMDSKELKLLQNSENKISKKLSEHRIEIERYRDIFKSNINGQNIKLTENEIKFFDELQKIEELEKETQISMIKDLCAASNIDYLVFESIRNKFKSDIKFQRALKPYFDHYINSNK